MSSLHKGKTEKDVDECALLDQSYGPDWVETHMETIGKLN